MLVDEALCGGQQPAPLKLHGRRVRQCSQSDACPRSSPPSGVSLRILLTDKKDVTVGAHGGSFHTTKIIYIANDAEQLEPNIVVVGAVEFPDTRDNR